MKTGKVLKTLLFFVSFLLFLTGCDNVLAIIGDGIVDEGGDGSDYDSYYVYNLDGYYSGGTNYLSWDYSEGANYYRVYWSTNEYNNYQFLGSTYDNNYSHSGLSSDMYYYYYVTVVDYDGIEYSSNYDTTWVSTYTNSGGGSGDGTQQIYDLSSWNYADIDAGEDKWYYADLSLNSTFLLTVNDLNSGYSQSDYGDVTFTIYHSDQSTPYSGFVDVDSTSEDGISVPLDSGETSVYIKFTGVQSGSIGFWPGEATVSSVATLYNMYLPDVYDFDFYSNSYEYDITVSSFNTSFTFGSWGTTDEGATVTATIDGDYADISSGSLIVGNFEFYTTKVVVFTVTASDGSTTQPYTFNLTQLSSNNNLSSLVFSDGTVMTDFSGDITVSVPADQTTLTVTPTAEDSYATILINGDEVASGTESAAIDVENGLTYDVFQIEIFKPDGSGSNTYYVNVEQLLSGDFDLAVDDAVTIDFDETNKVYDVTVPYGTTSAFIAVTPLDSTADVTIDGVSGTTASIDLNDNFVNTSVTVVVTPDNGNGTAETFTINIEPSWTVDSPQNATELIYNFDVSAGNSYTVYWQDMSDDSDLWTEEIELEVYKEDGVTLITNLNSSSTFTADANETVELKVTATDYSNVGTFAIKVEEDDPFSGSDWVIFNAADTVIIVQ